MIFESSGMPVPTEEEVRFEAKEMVARNGWGLPLLEALRKVKNPYWREAVTRCLQQHWDKLLRDKNEQTYYYDMDGAVTSSWENADYDFSRIIRTCTAEQVVRENMPAPVAPQPIAVKTRAPQVINNYYINQHNGPIITDSHVTIYSEQ